MHFQLTHVISIYETIKNPYDGEKKITSREKKKQNPKNLTFGRITLPTTEQSNSLIGQNTDDYIIMRKLMGLINLQEKFKLELSKPENFWIPGPTCINLQSKTNRKVVFSKSVPGSHVVTSSKDWTMVHR